MKDNTWHGWMVDPRGRCVCVVNEWWAEMLQRGLPEDQKFKKLELYCQEPEGEPGTVLVHRPSGGLGDIICLLSAVKEYQIAYPHKSLTIAIPPIYHWLVDSFDIEAVVVNYEAFHSIGFNQARSIFAEQFFMWCPAGIHEQQTNYKPREGRIKNFANVMGVQVSSVRINL